MHWAKWVINKSRLLIQTNYAINNMKNKKSQDIRELVKVVLGDPSTAFYPKWNMYISMFFFNKDCENFSERIEDSDFQEFTQKICIASQRFLETQYRS